MTIKHILSYNLQPLGFQLCLMCNKLLQHLQPAVVQKVSNYFVPKNVQSTKQLHMVKFQKTVQ